MSYGLVLRKVDLYSPGVYKALGGLSIVCAVLSGLGLLWFAKKAFMAFWKGDKQVLRTPRVDTGAQATYEKGVRAERTGK